jgi:hypothetical protein
MGTRVPPRLPHVRYKIAERAVYGCVSGHGAAVSFFSGTGEAGQQPVNAPTPVARLGIPRPIALVLFQRVDLNAVTVENRSTGRV